MRKTILLCYECLKAAGLSLADSIGGTICELEQCGCQRCGKAVGLREFVVAQPTGKAGQVL